MHRHRVRTAALLALVLAALMWGGNQGTVAATGIGDTMISMATSVAATIMATTADAAAQGAKAKAGKVTRDQVYPKKFQKVAPSELKAARKRAAKLGLKPGVAGLTGVALGAPLPGIEGPGGVRTTSVRTATGRSARCRGAASSRSPSLTEAPGTITRSSPLTMPMGLGRASPSRPQRWAVSLRPRPSWPRWAPTSPLL